MMKVEGDRDHPYMARAEHLPHFFVLNQKEIWMKFNKDIVIQGKMMNRNKIFFVRKGHTRYY
jgi:hypothetical protein